MLSYKAPLRDIRFVREEVFDFSGLYESLPGCEETTPDLVYAIFDEAAKFAENTLAPLYSVGDQQGCTWSEDGVTTPAGFADAYQQYVEGGWASLSAPVEYGGQGLPPSISMVTEEMYGTANWAWSMYPGLSHGAIRTLEHHGSEEQKTTYLPKLVQGAWTGTMCLTESHAGSDLGMLRTKAEPAADGSYRITGTKIFISAGEHDLAENIVHIVLARLPDAPPGTKGISLFLVPKMLPAEDGSLERNQVKCGSIEHKMGIHGSATCVMHFDSAVGYLIGEANRGLNHMFTFMNAARLGTAAQGLAHAELSYQGAVAYARERIQSRSLTGPKNPDKPADPIIVHPNVRRMLLTQRAFAEGGRALLYYLARQVDISQYSQDEEQVKRAEDLLALLTPVAKAFMTETGYESANLGVQVLGGHGYIREGGMEQIVRDARIAMIYEGTTGIQALDFIGRKVIGSGGELLRKFGTEVQDFCEIHGRQEGMQEFVEPLVQALQELERLTHAIVERAIKNADEAGAAAVEYLMFAGYVVYAYMWARMAKAALDGGGDPFYSAKLKTARFYFQRLLPRTRGLAACVESGGDALMALSEEEFALAG